MAIEVDTVGSKAMRSYAPIRAAVDVGHAVVLAVCKLARIGKARQPTMYVTTAASQFELKLQVRDETRVNVICQEPRRRLPSQRIAGTEEDLRGLRVGLKEVAPLFGAGMKDPGATFQFDGEGVTGVRRQKIVVISCVKEQRLADLTEPRQARYVLRSALRLDDDRGRDGAKDRDDRHSHEKLHERERASHSHSPPNC